ncbi:MAG TPA: arsenate reductase ArsC [Dehalococcoidia bacterium]|nr:arsenate reductase ArsC [Dehalococcoidia bacterium]
MKKILFVCVHNSGRSQIAEAIFNSLIGNKALALSAGTKPAERVNPVVVEAMREIDLDISKNSPKLLTLEMLEDSDLVITMGCNVREACPASFVQAEDWELDDPTGKSIEQVRQIRDQVDKKVKELVKHAARIERPLLIRVLLEKVIGYFRRL